MYVEISFLGYVIILNEKKIKHISSGTNNSCSRRNVLARYGKKFLISFKLFYRASVTRVMLTLLSFLFENIFGLPIQKEDLMTMGEIQTMPVRHGMLNSTHSNTTIE